MTHKQIAAMGKLLLVFLKRFANCFGRSDARRLLEVYVKGQLSDLHRKTAEAIALKFDTAPRTLQRFLESVKWDEEKLRDECQKIVAAEHVHAEAIGILDESGTGKSGQETVGAARQYNGHAGKIDNCTVGVHLSYSAPGFQCLLDSRVYLTEDYAADEARRKKTYVPEDIEFLTKPQIGLELIDRALQNGIVVKAWTFDELYGGNGPFLNALEQRGQVFVCEIPSSFYGWVRQPETTAGESEEPEKHRGKGTQPHKKKKKKKKHVKSGHPVLQVRNLAKYSPVFRKQSWQKYRIKDTQKGPEVWEVKWSEFWRKDENGLPGRRQTLIVARNVLTGEIKYFLSNRVPGDKLSDGSYVSLRWLLSVAFGRWSVEAVFREAKEELGLDHYEVRGWRCVHRHFYVTQLSQLFCARIRQAFDQQKNEKESHGRLTVEQVRSAMNVWLQYCQLPPKPKLAAFQQELDRQQYHQNRNEQARQSHTKTRRRRLKALGIEPDTIKSCIP